MLDLASSLSQIPDNREAPWAGYEYVKGWAVLALPFPTNCDRAEYQCSLTDEHSDHCRDVEEELDGIRLHSTAH
jgi:hypothetical protein